MNKLRVLVFAALRTRSRSARRTSALARGSARVAHAWNRRNHHRAARTRRCGSACRADGSLHAAPAIVLARDVFGAGARLLSRLGRLPRTYADCNPISSPDGQVVIVFAGEHFSHGSNGNGHKAGALTNCCTFTRRRGNASSRISTASSAAWSWIAVAAQSCSSTTDSAWAACTATRAKTR